MAGVTDTVFRRLQSAHRQPRPPALTLRMRAGVTDIRAIPRSIRNQRSGCGLMMTEFTSADGRPACEKQSASATSTFYDDEHPIAAQLFGANPETLAEAARIVEDTGFDLVDLNLGCPAKRVVKCNGGSGLLRDLPLIGKIFRSRALGRVRFPSP